jgi:hypothetical protein
VNDNGYRIELFVFPDGTSVEMIVFDKTAQQRGAAMPAAPPAPCCVPAPGPGDDAGVRTCPACGSTLVYPVEWERSGESSWTMTLRCPECETRREVLLGRASVEQFNRELYHGAQLIAREAERMSRRNFEDEVERIVVALERDLIQPMDF